jgi:RNA polymerase sigma-70 factor (ECF subfamily)
MTNAISILSRLPDDELVALVRRGRHDAFAEIDARYRGPLLGFARRLLGGSDEAQDVVQDSLARAHRSLIASDRPVALHAWLYTIVRNRALDVLRSPKRGHAELSDAVHAAPEAHCDPFAQAVQRDAMRRLVHDIQALPDRQRAALVLREIDGLSYEEVAERLHVTLPATKSLLVRARAGLDRARPAAA